MLNEIARGCIFMIPEIVNFEKLKESFERRRKIMLVHIKRTLMLYNPTRSREFGVSASDKINHFSFRMKLTFQIQLRLNERVRYDTLCFADRVSR